MAFKTIEVPIMGMEEADESWKERFHVINSEVGCIGGAPRSGNHQECICFRALKRASSSFQATKTGLSHAHRIYADARGRRVCAPTSWPRFRISRLNPLALTSPEAIYLRNVVTRKDGGRCCPLGSLRARVRIVTFARTRGREGDNSWTLPATQ